MPGRTGRPGVGGGRRPVVVGSQARGPSETGGRGRRLGATLRLGDRDTDVGVDRRGDRPPGVRAPGRRPGDTVGVGATGTGRPGRLSDGRPVDTDRRRPQDPRGPPEHPAPRPAAPARPGPRRPTGRHTVVSPGPNSVRGSWGPRSGPPVRDSVQGSEVVRTSRVWWSSGLI